MLRDGRRHVIYDRDALIRILWGRRRRQHIELVGGSRQYRPHVAVATLINWMQLVCRIRFVFRHVQWSRL